MSHHKDALFSRAKRHFQPNRVERLVAGGIDFIPDKRHGYYLVDVDGRELLDLHLNGGTFNLGHCHPELVQVLADSAAEVDIGNHHFISEAKLDLADALLAVAPDSLDYVVFASSGSEANDIAIKSARRATLRRKIVSVTGGYHGRTGLSGASGDASSAQDFLSDYPDEFISVAFNDLDAMAEALKDRDVALVMLEPLPATCGFLLPDEGYLTGVRALCDDTGTLLLFDEVQTGLGRSGKVWAHSHWQVEPDMMVLGKGLSGGLYPMAATLLSDTVAGWLKEDGWGHVSTFGGSDLGCKVALRALQLQSSAKTLNNVTTQAAYLREGLEKLKPRFPFFSDIRQLGLIFGLKMANSAMGFGMMRALYENGIWALVAGFDESVVQFKPGLLVDKDYCDEVLARFENACIWLVNHFNELLTGGNPDPASPHMLKVLAQAEQALVHWGLQGSELTLVKHRENTVYKITTGTGEHYALRLHRNGYHTDAELVSECQWMRALQQAGIDTPAIVATREGTDIAHVGESRQQCSLLAWLPGELFSHLGRVERGVAEEQVLRFRRLGELAGKVHNQSSGWQAPHGFTRPRWDADGLLGEQPLWGRFWEHPVLTPAQRTLFLKARVVLNALLQQIGTGSEHFSLIHADFLPDNILVDGEALRLIDFDDCGYGWHLFEMATSLFPLADEPYFDDVVAAYVEGYRTLRPLSDQHLEYLPAFIMLRGFTYMGWLMTRAGSMPNGDKLATEIARGLCEFIPQLLGHISPLQRAGVALLVAARQLGDRLKGRG